MPSLASDIDRRENHIATLYAHLSMAVKIAFIVTLIGSVDLAWCTSIVVEVEQKQIIIAADTLGKFTSAETTGEAETYCKILTLGNFAFAVTGLIDYIPDSPHDLMSAWDSRADADASYALHRTDLRGWAREWASRAQSHYSEFYRTNPSRVLSLLPLESASDTLRPRVLLVGLFIGFDNREPVVIAELIYLDSMNLQPIGTEEKKIDISESPFSTHKITQELLHDDSERAQIARKDWAKQSLAVPPDSITYRKLEFFIQRTAQLDNTVGSTVNILELNADKPPRWIQSPTCP